MGEEEQMVTAAEIVKQFGIPRSTLYRLAEEGVIPSQHEPAPAWRLRQRRQYRFKPSEVEAALARLKEERPPPARDSHA